jgi:hypothetical protein
VLNEQSLIKLVLLIDILYVIIALYSLEVDLRDSFPVDMLPKPTSDICRGISNSFEVSLELPCQMYQKLSISAGLRG